MFRANSAVSIIMVGKDFKMLIDLLAVLPISSAECEHGFSQMNLIHTSARNRLLCSTVSDLMMVCINGPPLQSWNATKYVVRWLKSGRHGALDKATGVPKNTTDAPKSTLLFAQQCGVNIFSGVVFVTLQIHL